MKTKELKNYATLLIGMSTDFTVGNIDVDTYISNLRMIVEKISPPQALTDEEIADTIIDGMIPHREEGINVYQFYYGELIGIVKDIRSLVSPPQAVISCGTCNGYGYTAEHDPSDPHVDGECTNCPIQVQCEACKGEGVIQPQAVKGIKGYSQKENEAYCKGYEAHAKQCRERQPQLLTDEVIEFADYLVGHGEETIKQMYNDWRKSR